MSAEFTHHPMPFTRIELVVLSIVGGDLAVLIGKRTGRPYAGRWALPGGVLHIDDEDLEAAAQRVARERLNTELPVLRQLFAVGSKTRDPRAPFSLSIVYRALLPEDAIKPEPGKRIETLSWRPVNEVVGADFLAFDHGMLVANAVATTRKEIEALELPYGYLPEAFTLGELQATCEAILGRRLDKSSFRRRIDERDLLEPVPGAMRTGAFRPAQLFRRRKIPE